MTCAQIVSLGWKTVCAVVQSAAYVATVTEPDWGVIAKNPNRDENGLPKFESTKVPCVVAPAAATVVAEESCICDIELDLTE